jgi:hypothetical protein
MKPLAEILVDAFPDEHIVRASEVFFEARAVGRLGKVPLSGGRVRSLSAVPMLETERLIVLDQRPGVARNVRRAVRVALPVAVASATTFLLPVPDVVHAVLALPGAVAGMVLSTAIGGAQANRGTSGLSNVIVIDKSLAESDATDEGGVRTLSGESFRGHLFVTSLAVRLDDAGKLRARLFAPPGEALVTAPLFRALRRHAPRGARVRTTYRLFAAPP